MNLPRNVRRQQGYSQNYGERGYSSNLPSVNRRRRLGKPNQHYGQIRYRGVGWRANRMQVTDHIIRRRQFPTEAQRRRISLGTPVFTVGTEAKVRTFDYLPHVPAYRHLGHAVALGDDIIVSIDFQPTRALINLAETLLRNQGRTWRGSTEDYLKRLIRLVSSNFFQRAITEEIRPRIHKLVPYASGRLSKGMVATVNRCMRDIRTLPHILKLNTMDNLGNPVYYANPVNNMPTEWLAHPPNEPLTRIYYHRSGPKRYDLFDPFAETDWYSKVIDSAQNWIRRNMNVIFQEICNIFGVNMVSLGIYQNIRDHMVLPSA